MRNLILIFVAIATLSSTTTLSANDSNNPVVEIAVLQNEDVAMYVKNSLRAEENIQVNYDNNFISINTKNEIAFLQVVNMNDELEYQLPIGSNKVNLSSEDFTKGVYKVNLLFKDKDNYVSTTLEKF